MNAGHEDNTWITFQEISANIKTPRDVLRARPGRTVILKIQGACPMLDSSFPGLLRCKAGERRRSGARLWFARSIVERWPRASSLLSNGVTSES